MRNAKSKIVAYNLSEVGDFENSAAERLLRVGVTCGVCRGFLGVSLGFRTLTKRLLRMCSSMRKK